MIDLIALRHKYDDLHGNGEMEFLYKEGSTAFAVRRGDLMMFFNPLGKETVIATDCDGDVIYKIGEAVIENGRAVMQPQSFLLIKNN